MFHHYTLEIHDSSLDEAQPADLVEASKRFGGLKFGSIFWFCSDCKNMFQDYGCILNFFRKSLDDGKTPVVKAVDDNGEQHFDSSKSERDTLLQKLTAESNEMKSKLDNVLEFMEKFSGATPFSPVRKAARITFHDGDENPAMSMFDASDVNTCGQLLMKESV